MMREIRTRRAWWGETHNSTSHHPLDMLWRKFSSVSSMTVFTTTAGGCSTGFGATTGVGLGAESGSFTAGAGGSGSYRQSSATALSTAYKELTLAGARIVFGKFSASRTSSLDGRVASGSSEALEGEELAKRKRNNKKTLSKMLSTTNRSRPREPAPRMDVIIFIQGVHKPLSQVSYK